MRNPVKALALRLRNGNGHSPSLDSGDSAEPAEACAGQDSESEEQSPERAVLRGQEYPVLAAIWDNDDDAVYDSL